MPVTTPAWHEIERVLDACPALDEYQGYYRQFDVPHRRVSTLVPSSRQFLQASMRPEMRVLDVGCGRGNTLLDGASTFRHGDGIDESAGVMIRDAKAEQARRGIRNVQFQTAKASALPFADGTFDFVFSERGPLCHQDTTLREALRVLRPGGLLFIETIGAWNSWETRAAFEPGYVRPASPLEWLDSERQRLQRHGVQVSTLASRLEALEFDTFADWVQYQLYSWSPPGREVFSPYNLAALQRFADLATSPQGTIRVTVHTLWLAGGKQDHPAAS